MPEIFATLAITLFISALLCIGAVAIYFTRNYVKEVLLNRHQFRQQPVN